MKFAWPDIELTALRLALGPLAVHARSVGKWCVILATNPQYAGGVRITMFHDERGRATLEALQFARDWCERLTHMQRDANDEVVATTVPSVRARKRRASLGGATPGIFVAPMTEACPKCGESALFAFTFGHESLGVTCQLCSYERPEV